jgi:hypothetical protein
MRYYKIEGILQVKDDLDVDHVTDIMLEHLDSNEFTFGGGIKEVDEQGNDIEL